MITQSKKAKGVVIKALLTLPLFALLLFANCTSNGQSKATSEQTAGNKEMTTIKLSEESYISFPNPMPVTIDGKEYSLDINSVKKDRTFKLGDHKVYVKNNNDERKSYSATIDGKPFDLATIINMVTDTTEAAKDDDEVFNQVDVMPEYPGGMNAMFEFIQKNVKYPESAKEKGIEGKVYVQFVVEKDGSLSSFNIARGVCEDIDAEAIRVLKSMPKWKPGMKDGKPVRVQYMMPFNFKFTGNEKAISITALSGTHWLGCGFGNKENAVYVLDMSMDFYNDNDGLFVMKLSSKEKGKEQEVIFENVALDFTYSFDGKSAGSIQPKNTDGSTLGGEEQQPYSFVKNGKEIIVNFYDFKEDTGIEKITFVKK